MGTTRSDADGPRHWQSDGFEAPASPLKSFRRTSTTEDVLVAVREAIVVGELDPGSPTRDAALAQRLGVGRGAVREALRQLVQEGLLEYRLNRGTFVRAMTVDDVRDVYLAREAIETQAVEHIITGSREPDLSAVMARLDALRRAQTAPQRVTIEADVGLHRSIVELARSARLARMFETLLAETRMFLLRNHPDYGGQHNTEEHVRIVEAIGNRTPNATEMMRTHLRTTLDLIVDSIAVESATRAHDSGS